MIFLLIYGFAAFLVWLVINLTLWHALKWRSGIKYWIISCAMVPMMLIGYAIFILVTFVPPAVYDESMPDPGPYNFYLAMTLGFVPSFIYFVISLPLSFAVNQRANPK